MEVTVKVNEKSYRAGMALAKFVKDAKAALASGQPLFEVTEIASAALSDLLPVLKDVGSLAPEAQADMMAELTTLDLVGQAVYQAVVS